MRTQETRMPMLTGDQSDKDDNDDKDRYDGSSKDVIPLFFLLWNLS